MFNVLRLLLVLIFYFCFLIYYFVAPGCSVASFDMYCVPRVRNKHIIIIIIFMSSIGSQRASTGGGVTDMTSLLNTELYCLFRMAALPLASDTVRPLSFNGDVPVLSRLHDLMNFQNLFWVWVLSFPERIESIFGFPVF